MPLVNTFFVLFSPVFENSVGQPEKTVFTVFPRAQIWYTTSKGGLPLEG